MSALSPAERETVILFNDSETTAIVETCSTAWKRKMRALCSRNADCCLVFEDQHCQRYRIPKSWVKVHSPRQYTEEQRRKMKERALNALHGRVEK